MSDTMCGQIAVSLFRTVIRLFPVLLCSAQAPKGKGKRSKVEGPNAKKRSMIRLDAGECMMRFDAGEWSVSEGCH
jgi:hypothetical protein